MAQRKHMTSHMLTVNRTRTHDKVIYNSNNLEFEVLVSIGEFYQKLYTTFTNPKYPFLI